MQNILTIAGTLVAIIGSLGFFMWRMNESFKSSKNEIAEIVKQKEDLLKDELELKTTRIYTRLDEVKEDTDKKRVHKDLCKVINENNRREMTELKTKVDDVATDIKAILKAIQINGNGKISG